MKNTFKNITLLFNSPNYPYFIDWLIPSLFIYILIFFQIAGESRDWQNYDIFFDLLRSEGSNIFGISRFEVGFVTLSFLLVNLFVSNIVVFGVIAASAFFLKCWVIYNLSPSRFIFCLTTIFYLVRFAPLHEMTQLRVACSAAFLLLAYILLQRGSRFGCFTACTLALAFHLSAIMLIPILFMQLHSRKIVIIVSAVIFIITLLGVGLIQNLLLDSIAVVRMYQDAGFGDEIPNPLSFALMLDWLMISVGLVMWNRLNSQMKHMLLVQLIGMAIFYASMDFAVISHRLREFLSIFWIVFIAEGLNQEKIIREIIFIFIISNLLLYSYIFVFSENFFL